MSSYGRGDAMDAVGIFSNLVPMLDSPMAGMGCPLHSSHVRYLFSAAIVMNLLIPGCSIRLIFMS